MQWKSGISDHPVGEIIACRNSLSIALDGPIRDRSLGLFTLPSRVGHVLARRNVPLFVLLVDRTIVQRLCQMRLHHLLSHDGQQLAGFTFSQGELLMLISLRYCLCCREQRFYPSLLLSWEPDLSLWELNLLPPNSNPAIDCTSGQESNIHHIVLVMLV